MDTKIRRRSRPRLERLEARSLLTASGSLDPTFHSGIGYSTLPISSVALSGLGTGVEGTSGTGTAAAVQSDGKVIVVGTGTVDGTQHTTFLITRFDANGTLDTSFGTGGRVVIPFNNLATASAVAIQPDGKIVVGGVILESVPTVHESLPYDYAAARLNADGSLDPSFGTGGTTTFTVGGPANPIGMTNDLYGAVTVQSVLIQSDGSIDLAGNAENSTSTAVDFAVARLTPAGVVDATYGTGGSVLVAIPGGGPYAFAAAAAIQSGDQIVLAGTTETAADPHLLLPAASYLAVIRLTTSGTLDPTFGSTDLPGIAHPFSTAGFGTGSVQYSASGIAIQSDGKIVLGANGASPNAPSTIRLDAAGSLDTTFGTGGLATYANAMTSVPNAGGVAIDPNGNIVVLGSLLGTSSASPSVKLARFTPAGAVDTTFGDPATPGLGVALAAGSAGNSSTIDTSLAIGSDGELIVASSLRYDSTVDPLHPVAQTFQNYLVVGQALSVSTTSTPVLQQPQADYDGSGTTNLAVYLPASGSFAYRPTPILSPPLSPPVITPDVVVPFGIPGAGQTLPAPGDYDGVGHTEIAAYLTASGDYAIRNPATGTDRVFQFGTPGLGNTLPAPGDYEGTGKTDVAVYLTGPGAFAILPSDGSAGRIVQLGSPGPGQSIPAPADYFGTGQDDLAVYLQNFGAFAVADPSGQTAGAIVPFGHGGQGDIPTPGDFNGAGHVDLAIYVPAYGAFFYRPYGGGADVVVKIGTAGAGDLPVIGKFDGSALDEFGVYDPATGSFLYQPAGGGAEVTVPFGSAGAGQSIPTSTPPGALSGFAAPGPGSGTNAIHILSLATKSASIAGPTTPSAAVPGGPAASTARVALRLVAQAVTPPGGRIE